MRVTLKQNTMFELSPHVHMQRQLCCSATVTSTQLWSDCMIRIEIRVNRIFTRFGYEPINSCEMVYRTGACPLRNDVIECAQLPEPFNIS